MNNSNLEFRKIPSLDFLYEINENGTILRNVKSKKQMLIKLDMHHSNNGYYAAWIHIKGKTLHLMIHKLVAECWLGDIPEGYEIDHIDRNPHNNHYTNLRYVTHSEQMKNMVMSQRIIENASRNCSSWNRSISNPVEINCGQGTIHFPSYAECSRFLAEEYDKSFDHIRHKLKQGRSKIYDYDVDYLRNAQTGHCDSTE